MSTIQISRKSGPLGSKTRRNPSTPLSSHRELESYREKKGNKDTFVLAEISFFEIKRKRKEGGGEGRVGASKEGEEVWKLPSSFQFSELEVSLKRPFFVICTESGELVRKLPLSRYCCWFVNLMVGGDVRLVLQFGKFLTNVPKKEKNYYFEVPICLNNPPKNQTKVNITVKSQDFKINKTNPLSKLPSHVTFTFVRTKTRKNANEGFIFTPQQLLPSCQFDNAQFNSRKEDRVKFVNEFIENTESKKNELTTPEIFLFQDLWKRQLLWKKVTMGSFIRRLLHLENNLAYMTCYNVLSLEKMFFHYFDLCVKEAFANRGGKIGSPLRKEETDGEGDSEKPRYSTISDFTSYFASIGMTADYWDTSRSIFLDSLLRSPGLTEEDRKLLSLNDSFISRFYERYMVFPACVQLKEDQEILSKENIKQARDVWALFSSKFQALGVEFYQTLFEKYPAVIDFFEDTNMDHLALHLFQAIDAVMGLIDDFPNAIPTLLRLADTHMKALVPPALYGPVVERVVELLAKHAGGPIPDNIAKLLFTTFGKVSLIMAEPMVVLNEKIDAAKSFLELAHRELGWINFQLTDRTGAVEQEIRSTGTFRQTSQELQMGIKVAWRNSAPPAARITWQSLFVRDCRHAKSPREMFEEVVEHLMVAETLSGEGVVSVFRPKYSGEVWGPRIWNTRIIQYASYPSSYMKVDGKKWGSPSSVAFTQRCILQGWNPPSPTSPFDILPVVFQIPGSPIQMFQIPPDAILQVPLFHPSNPMFSNLSLRWPAVSPHTSLRLTLGGIEYGCFLMSERPQASDIVAQLVDHFPSLEEEVALLFGIDLSLTPQWRQIARCHVSTAVFYSYRDVGIEIVDDVMAAEFFLAHQRAELSMGRPTNGWWNACFAGGGVGGGFGEGIGRGGRATGKEWGGGCLSALEVRGEKVGGPTFEMQSDVWDLEWGDGWRKKGEVGAPGGENGQVRDVGGEEEKDKAYVLYGSQTGTVEEYGKQVSRRLRDLEFAHELKAMDDFLPTFKQFLDKDKCPTIVLLILSSTFSNGTPPDNATHFVQFLTSKYYSKNWHKVHFSVLGFGSKVYHATYCKTATTIDNTLASLSAHRMTKIYKVDELEGAAASKKEWFRLVRSVIFPTNEEEEGEDKTILSVKPGNFTGIIKPGWENRCVSNSANHLGSLAICTENLELIEDATEQRSTRLIRLTAKSGEDLHYTAGDHVSIRPVNPSSLVEKIAEIYGIGTEDMLDFVSLKRGVKKDKEKKKEKKEEGSPSSYEIIDPCFGDYEEGDPILPFPFPASFSQIFGLELDLSLPPTLSEPVFNLLMAYEKDSKKIRKLERMYTRKQAEKSHRNIVDLLLAFPSSRPPLGRLIETLPRLRPRFYSISSSPLTSPMSIDLTVNVAYSVPNSSSSNTSSTGSSSCSSLCSPNPTRGVCATFLANLTKDCSLVRFTIQRSQFRLPNIPGAPILMVGPGTGIAPFISFGKELEQKLNPQLNSSPSVGNSTPPRTRCYSLTNPSPSRRRTPSPKRARIHSSMNSCRPHSPLGANCSQCHIRLDSSPRSLTNSSSSPHHSPRKVGQTASSTYSTPRGRLTKSSEALGSISPNHSTPQEIGSGDTEETVSEDNFSDMGRDKDRWCRLYHGCRNDKDILHKDVLYGWEKTEVLTSLRIAQSRGETKKLVQNLLIEDGEEIWEKMSHPDFHFYICGDGRMANDVLVALMSIAASQGGLEYYQIVELFEKMKKEERYQTNVWGVILDVGEAATEAIQDLQKRQKTKNQRWLKNVKSFNEEAQKKKTKIVSKFKLSSDDAHKSKEKLVEPPPTRKKKESGNTALRKVEAMVNKLGVTSSTKRGRINSANCFLQDSQIKPLIPFNPRKKATWATLLSIIQFGHEGIQKGFSLQVVLDQMAQLLVRETGGSICFMGRLFASRTSGNGKFKRKKRRESEVSVTSNSTTEQQDTSPPAVSSTTGSPILSLPTTTTPTLSSNNVGKHRRKKEELRSSEENNTDLDSLEFSESSDSSSCLRSEQRTEQRRKTIKRDISSRGGGLGLLYQILSLCMVDEQFAFNPTTIPLPTLFSQALLSGEVVVENNSSALISTFHSFPINVPSFVNFLGVPMVAGGEPIGVLGLANAKSGSWTTEQADLLLPFASLLAGVVLLADISCSSKQPPPPSIGSRRGQGGGNAHIGMDLKKRKGSWDDDDFGSFDDLETDLFCPSEFTFPDVLTHHGAPVSRNKRDDDDLYSSINTMTSPAPKPFFSLKRQQLKRNRSQLSSLSFNPTITTEKTRDRDLSGGDIGSCSSPLSHDDSSRHLRKCLSWNSLYTQKMAALGNAMGHVFESLSEGIIVFDGHRVVVTCNAAAASMLRFDDRSHLMTKFAKIDELIRPVCRVQGGEEMNGHTKDWSLDLKNLLAGVVGGKQVRFEAQLNVHSSTHQKGNNTKERRERSGSDTELRRGASSPASPKAQKLEIGDSERTTRTRRTREKRGGEASTEEFVFVDLALTTFWYRGERYFSAVFRDMTQDKVFQEKDVLLAFLSHEIRNPVQAIISGSEELIRLEEAREEMEKEEEGEGSRDPGELHLSDIARDVYMAADLLHAVVNETIDFVQISSRNFVAKHEEFDLLECLHTCSNVYTTSKAECVSLAPPNIDPHIPRKIRADRSRISQIVGNLLSNASKFTEKGSIQIKVEKDETGGRAMVVSVTDTGCGIPASEQAKLFQLFTHIKGDRRHKHLSTGLGLLLSRRLARALNGDLYLAQSSRNGSTFSLQMPYEIVEEKEPIPRQLEHKKVSSLKKKKGKERMMTPRAAKAEWGGNLDEKGKGKEKREKKKGKKKAKRSVNFLGKYRILVVDDNPLVLRVLLQVLRGCPHLFSASNGREALDKYEEEGGKFDLVVMDCLMPVLDGYKAASMLREKDKTIPIIALTGNSMETDIEKAQQSGFDLVLIKPLRSNELLNAVEQLLTEGRAV